MRVVRIAHHLTLRCAAMVLASTALLIAMMTCSLTEESSMQTHHNEHEGDASDHGQAGVCCATLVAILPEGGPDLGSVRSYVRAKCQEIGFVAFLSKSRALALSF